jgi:hypothetical protein
MNIPFNWFTCHILDFCARQVHSFNWMTDMLWFTQIQRVDYIPLVHLTTMVFMSLSGSLPAMGFLMRNGSHYFGLVHSRCPAPIGSLN